MPLDTDFGVVSTNVGSLLQQILDADDIQVGDQPSYELCKTIYVAHPLGNKMAETPIRLAQCRDREVTVPDSPEDEVVEAFNRAWRELQATRLALNLGTQARVYGISSLGLLDGGKPGEPVDLKNLWRCDDLNFNLLDPLNTAGSMVTNQDPNSPLFQKWGDVVVAGTRYHRSRIVTMMNEEPLYIAWTSSAFGFVGRSVYQRALYPLKSFLQTMRTDDAVTRKAALLVARLEQPGSIVDRMMQTLMGRKRDLLRRGQTGNVISIGQNELIEAINLRNVNDSMAESRNNIIKNIATACDMPAKLLTQESFVEGFGEGTQDAYAVAQYVDRVRIELDPAYRWLDTICQYRAWSPEFYETIQRKYADEYEDIPYTQAFYQWRNSFRATWPDLIREKPSEAVEIEDVKLKAVIAAVQVLGPEIDPENKADLIQWAVDQFNSNEHLFGGAQLNIDAETLTDFLTEQAQSQPPGGGGNEEGNEPHAPLPFSARDSLRGWLDSRPLGELGRRASDSKVRLLAGARS